MISYKNALLLLIFSGLTATVGAFLKIMQWSSISIYLMIGGLIGHFAAIGMGLYVFLQKAKAEKS
jgi:uncharacterized membrane protein